MARMAPGSAGGGRAAAAPNPQQPQLKPQLKSIPMIAKMEQAKQALRKPQARPRLMVGGPMTPGGSGREPAGPSAPPGLKFMTPPSGAESGGSMVEGPGMDAKIAGLPPHIQKAIATQGLDTVMANRAGLAGRLGLPPQTPPAANSGMPGSGVDISVSGMPGAGGFQAKPMPTGLPPGVEPGGGFGKELTPGARFTPEMMAEAQANTMRNAAQGLNEAGSGSFGPGGPGQARSFDVNSIQDLYQQLMPGRRPPQYGGAGGMGGFGGFGGPGGGGGMPGGGLPPWLAAAQAYRG